LGFLKEKETMKIKSILKKQNIILILIFILLLSLAIADQAEILKVKVKTIVKNIS